MPLVALGTAAAAFVLYLVTLAPTVVGGDTGELISAAWVMGVAHPPGYPLLTILERAAALLPVGEVAWRMNLLSAVFHAATVAVVVLTVGRLCAASAVVRERAPWWTPAVAGMTAGIALAVSHAFWSYALVAEVFPLNDLFAALLLFVLLEWYRDPGRIPLLWLVGLLSGLAASNQQTIILLAPGMLVLLVAGLVRLARSGERLPLAQLAVAPAFLLLGLLPYGYLPVAASRNPAMNWEDPDTLDRLFAVVTRASYGTFRLAATEAQGGVVEHLALIGSYLVIGLSPLVLVLAAFGAVRVWLRDRAVAAALVVCFLVAGPLFVVYANSPLDSGLGRGVIERFYLLGTIPLALLAGAGLGDSIGLFAGTGLARRRPALLVGAVVLAVGVTVALGAVRFPSVTRAGDHVAAGYAEDLLDWLEPDALLISRGDHVFTTTSWAQFVEQRRPDVAVLDVEMLKTTPYVIDRRARYPGVEIPFPAYDEGRQNGIGDLVAANVDQRPVYVVGVFKEDAWEDGYDLRRAGLATRVLPKGTAPTELDSIRADLRRYEALHYPERPHPDTTWESLMDHLYSDAAFDAAVTVQGEGPASDDQAAERLYRTALRLAPDRAEIYKNLGLLLFDTGGDLHEVVALWQHYLEVNPDDPQADQIRGQLGDILKTLR